MKVDSYENAIRSGVGMKVPAGIVWIPPLLFQTNILYKIQSKFDVATNSITNSYHLFRGSSS